METLEVSEDDAVRVMIDGAFSFGGGSTQRNGFRALKAAGYRIVKGEPNGQ